MDEPFRIGYALAAKKIKSFLQDSLKELAKSKGVELHAIDLSRPLAEQGPFDAVLHKLLDTNWYEQLEIYRRLHPEVLIIDPPESIQRVRNRVSMLQAVAEQRAYEYGSVGIPKQHIISAESGQGQVNQFDGADLSFPVIAKPLVADGSAVSHHMWLVFNKSGLERVEPPFLLQEFVNHGGVIFKVYVVDNYVKCCRRKSLPDVSHSELESHGGLQAFSQISNTSYGGTLTGQEIDASLASTPLPPMKLVVAISARLRKKLGLRLFNFDLIRKSEDASRFCIIDINYFPGYAKMPNYENVLTDFFVSLAQEKADREQVHPTSS